jgi:hypothetical protein
MHAQGFSGRTATTIHDATETGLSISGIFQAAEDDDYACWTTRRGHRKGRCEPSF